MVRNICERWGPSPLAWGVPDPLISHLCCMLPNLIAVCQTLHEHNAQRSGGKWQLLKPVGVSYCFGDKRRFPSKTAFFSLTRAFDAETHLPNPRLSRPWCEVAQAEIRTFILPIANPALYHRATSAAGTSVAYILLGHFACTHKGNQTGNQMLHCGQTILE